MDILDADMNLSVTEAELKIFEDEVKNSRIYEIFSNYDEQVPQERTEQYVTKQQPLIAPVYPPQESLVPQTVKQQIDSEQIFLNTNNRSTRFPTTNRHLSVQRTTNLSTAIY